MKLRILTVGIILSVCLINPVNAEFKESSIRHSYLSQSYMMELNEGKDLKFEPIKEPENHNAFFVQAAMIILSIFQ